MTFKIPGRGAVGLTADIVPCPGKRAADELNGPQDWDKVAMVAAGTPRIQAGGGSADS